MRLLPSSATHAARLLLVGRAVRGFVDGFVSVVLAVYLTHVGFSPQEIGAVVTATLIGSAVLTLAVGLFANRLSVRSLLLASCALMFATGVGFTASSSLTAFLAVAFVGTLNPSGGDVSVFLPTEQAYLADQVDPSFRPDLYARYNLGGTLAAAFGALAAGLPTAIAHAADWSVVDVERAGFLVYATAAIVLFTLYTGLPRTVTDSTALPRAGRTRLVRSRRIVLELAALFSLDSAGSGFVVQSLLVLWLHLRFDLSVAATGAVFFAASVLAAMSQLLAGRIVSRLGLIRTMVYTHVPANALLALAAFAPSSGIAVGLLLGRALLSQLDVPARQTFVMTVVPPEERAAASSVTNVPRSLASASTPLIAGALLSASNFGWPLLIAGCAKLTYDMLLLALYRGVPEEVGASRTPRGARRTTRTTAAP